MHIDEMPIVVRRKWGRHIAEIPQAGLYARGSTAKNAVAALEAKKSVLRDELTRAGVYEEVASRAGAQRSELPMLSALFWFAAKALTILLLALVAVAYIQSAFDQKMEQVRKMGGARFWGSLESELREAADPANNPPEQTKQEILANLHTLVARWRPFVREGQQLFSDPAPPNGR
jgi:hypothetical protein